MTIARWCYFHLTLYQVRNIGVWNAIHKLNISIPAGVIVSEEFTSGREVITFTLLLQATTLNTL